MPLLAVGSPAAEFVVFLAIWPFLKFGSLERFSTRADRTGTTAPAIKQKSVLKSTVPADGTSAAN
jgi:hypothetical protein